MIIKISSDVATGAVSVIDAVTERGAIKGHELETVGTIRRNLIEAIQSVEETKTTDQSVPQEPTGMKKQTKTTKE